MSVLAAVALSAVMWTWLAASAAAADQPPTPTLVKYYVVPRAGHGPTTLASIAAQTLGDAARFTQIFKLNKGRLQPNGGRLENPKLIKVGWVLELPPDATGPGVHFGALPRPSPPKRPTPHPQPRSSPATRPRAAPSSFSTVGFVVAALAIVIVGGLSVAGGLVLPRKGRRRRIASASRTHRLDRAPGLSTSIVPAKVPQRVPSWPDETDPDLWPQPPDAISRADWPADHPSRPQQAVDYQGWPPDHPSRPQQAVDYEGWPTDYPSRPQQAVGYQGWPYHGPGAPGGGALRGQPIPARPAGQPLPTRPSVPAGPASFAGPLSAQAYGQPPTQALASRAYGPPSVPAPPPEPRGAPWSTDTLRVASLLISEAEAEANKIRAEATAVREEATAEAAAVREAAEQEAEGLRAKIQVMSAELGEVAAFVTKRLAIPGTRTAPPTEALPTETQPTEGPQAKPAPAKSAPAKTTPTRKPSKPAKPAKPAKPLKPGQRPRQVRAIRMMVTACIGLTLLAAVAGTTEIGLHGLAFFVFRSAGTGATPSNGVQEDQGPGQPDAPGAHHHDAPRQHGPKQPKPKKQHGPKQPKTKKQHKPKQHKAKQPKAKQPKAKKQHNTR